LEQFIVLSRDNKKRIEDLKKIAGQKSERLSKLLYFFGQRAIKDFYFLNETSWNYDEIEQTQKPEFPLKAADIFHLTNAEGHEFIKGVVGWVDLRSFDVEERLAYYSSLPLMKGFRHVLQGEEDRALMVKPEFKTGISLLAKYGFTYDILIYPDQLRYAYQLASQLPNQKFVIDHLAKPSIKTGEIADWRRDIQAFAPLQNVSSNLTPGKFGRYENIVSRYVTQYNFIIQPLHGINTYFNICCCPPPIC